MYLQHFGASQSLLGSSAVAQMVEEAARSPCNAAIMLPRCSVGFIPQFLLSGWSVGGQRKVCVLLIYSRLAIFSSSGLAYGLPGCLSFTNGNGAERYWAFLSQGSGFFLYRHCMSNFLLWQENCYKDPSKCPGLQVLCWRITRGSAMLWKLNCAHEQCRDFGNRK
jgi:hypothetical protein